VSVRLRVLVAAVVVLLLPGCGGSESVPEDAIAVVDGRPIPRSDHQALLSQARKSYASQGRTFPKAGSREHRALKSQFVQLLVQRVQFEERAKDLDIEVTDAQVTKRLNEIKKQYFGGDAKKYEQQLEEQGLTDRQVRADVRAQLVSERIFAKVTETVRVTDEQIRKHYERNTARYRRPQSRVVRHILVKTRGEALDLRRRLDTGADFSALAKKHSLDTGTKESGGGLTVEKGQTVAPFDRAAFRLPVKRLSEPVKNEFGYHLIQPLSKITEARTTPLKDVRESIRQQLLQTRKNEAMTRWIAETSQEFEESTRYQTGFAPPAKTTGSVSLNVETTE
jgi:parvulin-like peptidyl-prolyl isomerase